MRPSACDERAREICQHPAADNPGPTLFMPTDLAPSCVQKHFGSDRRFLEDSCLLQNGSAIIKHSTHASVFSPTYPYQEPARTDHAASNSGESPSPSSKAGVARGAGSPKKAAVTDPDLNFQQVKYSKMPIYGFGSAGMGYRFAPGTQFSKRPAVPTSSPRLGFRRMRDALPDLPGPAKSRMDSEDAGV